MLYNMFAEAAGAAEVITLSGTSGSPNTITQTSTDPSDAYAGWRFLSDGTIDSGKDSNSSLNWTQFQSAVEWSDLQPSPGTHWIRATLDAGSTPNNINAGIGIWLAFGDHEWSWSRTIVNITAGTLKIEIATDSAGSNIVATGYYRGRCVVAPDFG